MGLFGARLIDRHTADWQFEHFEVLIRELSLALKLPDFILHLPTRENFQDPDNPGAAYQGHELAKFLLHKVQRQCGVGEIKLKLIPTQENKPEFLGGAAILQPMGNAAAGRYIAKENHRGEIAEEITYDGGLCENPAQMVATFAHELSHCLHNRMHNFPDFEEEIFYEMFTDLTAVYLGYGVFLANGKASFSSDGQTWASQSFGYLPESELVFATALFMKLRDISPNAPKPFLKPHLFKMLGKAFKQLGKDEDRINHLKKLLHSKAY